MTKMTEMTLNDLETGMIVITRDENSYIVMRDYLGSSDILAGLSDSNSIAGTWTHLSEYNNDMTRPDYPDMDIMKVYDSQPFSIDNIRYLIWKRKEHNDGWIPCSERLPEEHDSMFATLKGTSKWNDAMFEKVSDDVNVTVEFEDGTRKTKTMHTVDGEWKNDSFINMEIIAWRQLPEPYKEDEEE